MTVLDTSMPHIPVMMTLGPHEPIADVALPEGYRFAAWEPRLRVHWVGVDPAHQRRGLARALMLRTIALYDELVPADEPPLYLTTQTEIWVACGMYRKLGFVPYRGPMPTNFGSDPETFCDKNDEAWRLIDDRLRNCARSPR